MNIFEFNNYHLYLKNYLKSQPNDGYGVNIKIAKALNINPSIVSQVLAGKMDFTLEQGNDLAEYLGLSELESEYLFNLIVLSRSGKANLKERIERRLSDLKRKSQELSQRMPAQGKLNDSDQAVFYSQWYYSGARIATSIKDYQTIDALSEFLDLPRATVRRVVEFLVATGLCIQDGEKIKMGPQSTHLSSNSPLVARHHANWRQIAIERMPHTKSDELFFTSPFSITEENIAEIRTVLVRAIDDSFEIIDPSPEEKLACLNIDLFRVR